MEIRGNSSSSCSPLGVGGLSLVETPYPFGRPEMGDVVLNPGPHDVLLGRGGGTNNYCGNIKFRKLVNEHKMRYLTCSKVEKPNVAREVVQLWRKLNPPGRFLAKRDKDKKDKKDKKESSSSESSQPAVWIEVGDKKAREKASQCLRERTPDVLPLLRHMREQQDSSNAKAISLLPNSTNSPSGSPGASSSTDKIVVKVEKTDLPTLPSTRPSKAARAKRAAREKEASRRQARPTQDSEREEDLGDRNSPVLSSHPSRLGDLSPQSDRPIMDVHANNNNNMPSSSLGGLSRRNSMPADCNPHPHCFMDRRGSLPTNNSNSMHAADFSAAGMNMPFPPHHHHSHLAANETAMMQVHGRGRGRGPGSPGGGATTAGLTGLRNSSSSCGTSYPMPGQPQLSALETGPFHNASPYLDLYDSTSPLCSARFQQQRLRLQQLKLEQQQLQQQLDQQIQMEVEMHMARMAATGGGQRPPGAGAGAAAAGGPFVRQHASAPELMYPQHDDLSIHNHNNNSNRSHHRALQQPTYLSPAELSAELQHPHPEHHSRGVEAPGYLPSSTSDGALPVQDHLTHDHLSSSLQRSGHHSNNGKQSRERSDPPTEDMDLQPDCHNKEDLHHPRQSQVTPESLAKEEVDDDDDDMHRDCSDKEGVPRSISKSGSAGDGLSSPQRQQQQHEADHHSTAAGTAADPHGEMTLAEYRKTLDEYVASNNITIREQIYSDDERDVGPTGGTVADELSVRSFSEWKDNDYKQPSEESRNESPRPDPPAAREQHAAGTLNQRAPVPHIPRRALQRQQSGHSVVSSKTIRSSFTSLSGISMLSSTGDGHHHHQHHHPDDASMEEATSDGKTIAKQNFSCNESVVSEITVISHTIDGLGLGVDE